MAPAPLGATGPRPVPPKQISGTRSLDYRYRRALRASDCRIDVSIPGHEGHDIIHLAGIYPIHEVERQYIAAHDLKSFWDLEWDPYDVARVPAV